MANEQENKEILVLALGESKKCDFFANVKVSAQEEKKIVKILDTNCCVKVSGTQTDGDKTLVSGRVNVFVTYESDNNEIVLAKGEEDWTGQVDNNYPIVFEEIKADCRVDSYDENVVNVAARVIALVAPIETKGVGSKLDDEAQLELNKASFGVTKVLGSGSCFFEEQIEQNHNGDFQVVKRHAVCTIDNAYSGVDTATVEGNIFVTLLLKNNETFKELQLTLPYKQEMECFGANPGSFVKACANICDIQVGIKDGENDDKSISVVVQAEANAVSLEKEEVVSVIDAYSVGYNTKLTFNTVQNEDVSYIGYSNEDADFEINIGGRIGVDEILSVQAEAVGDLQCEIQEGQAKLLFNLEATVYYKNNNDGRVQTFIENCEVSTTIPVEDETSDVSNLKYVVLGHKFKAGNSIDVSGTLFFEETSKCSRALTYVSDVELEQDDSYSSNDAIKMHVVKRGETLFDIAKELKVGVDTLTSQNKDLLSGVIPGEKVYVYVPLSVNFE